MTRPLRIQYPDAWYHVMNRGRHRDEVFKEDEDYLTFINLLQEAAAAWKLKTAAYCLMKNHYHLLIQTPQANLDRCMRHINGIYTQRFNRKYHVDGQLFRGRYKAILVDADNYLLELVRYVHKNPVRAGIVRQPEKYPWSSHRGYLSESNNWNWLHKAFVLEMLDEKKAGQKKAFIDFMALGDSENIHDFYNKKNLSAILGSDRFMEKIKTQYLGVKKHKEVPQSCYPMPSIEAIRRIVAKTYKVQEENLSKTRRGYYNEARDVAVYLSRIHTGNKLDKIGTSFDIANYSTVSSIIVKMRELRKTDKVLGKRLLRIEQAINGH